MEVAPLAKGGKCPVTVLEIVGAAIRLEVKGMGEAADYFVVPGDTPGSFAANFSGEPRTLDYMNLNLRCVDHTPPVGGVFRCRFFVYTLYSINVRTE